MNFEKLFKIMRHDEKYHNASFNMYIKLKKEPKLKNCGIIFPPHHESYMWTFNIMFADVDYSDSVFGFYISCPPSDIDINIDIDTDINNVKQDERFDIYDENTRNQQINFLTEIGLIGPTGRTVYDSDIGYNSKSNGYKVFNSYEDILNEILRILSVRNKKKS